MSDQTAGQSPDAAPTPQHLPPQPSTTGSTSSASAASGSSAATAEEEDARRRRRNVLLTILALILLLLCLGGGLYWFVLRTKDPVVTPSATATTASPTPSASVTVSPTVSPTPTPPLTFDVPDVIGKTAEEAKQILGAAGFDDVTFVSGDDPADPVQILGEWKVTEQSPASGEKVTADTEIVLTVTKLGGGKG